MTGIFVIAIYIIITLHMDYNKKTEKESLLQIYI